MIKTQLNRRHPAKYLVTPPEHRGMSSRFLASLSWALRCFRLCFEHHWLKFNFSLPLGDLKSQLRHVATTPLLLVDQEFHISRKVAGVRFRYIIILFSTRFINRNWVMVPSDEHIFLAQPPTRKAKQGCDRTFFFLRIRQRMPGPSDNYAFKCCPGSSSMVYIFICRAGSYIPWLLVLKTARAMWSCNAMDILINQVPPGPSKSIQKWGRGGRAALEIKQEYSVHV